ncbi:MAG: hypothetical protein AB7D27_13755 [Desulfomicrobium sp.]
MAKKIRHTIWLEVETVARLKKIAALAELSQGDLFKTLLEMSKDGFALTPVEIEQAADAVVDYLTSRPQDDDK